MRQLFIFAFFFILATVIYASPDKTATGSTRLVRDMANREQRDVNLPGVHSMEHGLERSEHKRQVVSDPISQIGQVPNPGVQVVGGTQTGFAQPAVPAVQTGIQPVVGKR